MPLAIKLNISHKYVNINVPIIELFHLGLSIGVSRSAGQKRLTSRSEPARRSYDEAFSLRSGYSIFPMRLNSKGLPFRDTLRGPKSRRYPRLS